jgi:hypothetical protein
MSAPNPAQGRRIFRDLTAPGRSSFDWAVLFAAVALVLPVSGFAGVVFAERSRRKGYTRWKSAMAIAIWCAVLGLMLRGVLRIGVFP